MRTQSDSYTHEQKKQTMNEIENVRRKKERTNVDTSIEKSRKLRAT